MNSWRLKFFLFVFLVQLGCSNSFPGVSSTTQTLTNQGLKAYANLVLEIKLALENALDCGAFDAALATLPGVRQCLEEGTVTTLLVSSSCQDLPDFLGEAALQFEYDDCQENGVKIDKTLTMQILWDGNTLSASLAASNIVVNGIPQSFKDLSIVVEADDIPQCQGAIISNGQACGATPDCNFCPF